MIRWFKSAVDNFNPWRGRCAVDTSDVTRYIWYKKWPNLNPAKREEFTSSLQHNIDSGRWVEDESLALDKDLLVDEGL